MQSKRQRNTKKKGGKTNRRSDGARLGLGLERPYPASKIIKVTTTTDGAAQAAAAGFCVLEFRLGDPTNAGASGGTGGLSVATTGIADMAAYALARVRSARIELSGASLEPSSLVSVNMIFADTQPSTVITTYALAKAASIGYLHSPLMKISVLTGNSAFRFDPISVTATQVIGDRMPRTDRDFVTVVNPSHTAPSQEWWGAVIVTSAASGTNLTNGLDLNLTIVQTVESFSRLPGS